MLPSVKVLSSPCLSVAKHKDSGAEYLIKKMPKSDANSEKAYHNEQACYGAVSCKRLLQRALSSPMAITSALSTGRRRASIPRRPWTKRMPGVLRSSS